MTVMQLLAEGKTKQIFQDPGDIRRVRIVSKDDITAGDGMRHDVIADKGILSTRTTCNIFELLEERGVPTHFVECIDERAFTAISLRMIPIECVWRRLAYGSYLKRHPDMEKCTVFDDPVVELFWKNDDLHDPLMKWDEELGVFHLYDAKSPVEASFMDLKPGAPGCELLPRSTDEIAMLEGWTLAVGKILEDAWSSENVTLVDFKIEFGWSPDHRIVLGDVVDADSWRIWPGGQEDQMKDKQVYRNLPEPTPEALAQVKDNFAWIADATDRFLRSGG